MHILTYLKRDDVVLLEVLVDLAVEFAEGGQAGRAHPYDEVLILHA